MLPPQPADVAAALQADGYAVTVGTHLYDDLPELRLGYSPTRPCSKECSADSVSTLRRMSGQDGTQATLVPEARQRSGGLWTATRYLPMISALSWTSRPAFVRRCSSPTTMPPSPA